MMKCVLIIAGSDSGAGAGIQADLKTVASRGLYGTTAITAITAQNTTGVEKVQLLKGEMVAAQLDAVIEDFPVDAVKTGMLGNEEIVQVVAERIKRCRLPKVVVDPVMVAKSGDSLLEERARQAILEELFPAALLITPNLPEAEMLCGGSIKTTSDMKEAARSLREQGPAFILLKGGHLLEGEDLVDVLYDGRKFYYYRAPRVETRNNHGTGCTYASAIACGLARGKPVPLAVRDARIYLQRILPFGPGLGKGSGPMNHFNGIMLME